MYIIELIAHLINKYKKRKINNYKFQEEEEIESCDHIYFAIDSTKDYFACSKCGNVIKNNKPKKNIFEN